MDRKSAEYESYECDYVPPWMFDELMANGWYQVGSRFERTRSVMMANSNVNTIPLRIRLERFSRSKSHDRLWRRQNEFRFNLSEPDILQRDVILFEEHKQRFAYPPRYLSDMVPPTQESSPNQIIKFEVFDGQDNYVAASYMAVGGISTQGIYAMYKPKAKRASLGILTMLKEIDHSVRLGKEFYYLGTVYSVPTILDYKKSFYGLEAYEMDGSWRVCPRFDTDHKYELEIFRNRFMKVAEGA